MIYHCTLTYLRDLSNHKPPVSQIARQENLALVLTQRLYRHIKAKCPVLKIDIKDYWRDEHIGYYIVLLLPEIWRSDRECKYFIVYQVNLTIKFINLVIALNFLSSLFILIFHSLLYRRSLNLCPTFSVSLCLCRTKITIVRVTTILSLLSHHTLFVAIGGSNLSPMSLLLLNYPTNRQLRHNNNKP